MTGTFGVGILGSGFMGRTWAEVAAHHLASTRLVAVAGGRRAAALAADYAVTHEASAADLFANAAVDIAVVGTPPLGHEAQVRAAAEAGKHVLVEKPMAQSSAECARMIDACRHNRVKLAVVSQHRFRMTPRASKTLVDEGAIGAVTMVRVTGTETGWWDTDARGDGWKLDARQQTVYASWAAHACDLLRWLVGSHAVAAFASFDSYGDAPPPGQSAMATYLFESRAMAQVWMTYELPKPAVGSPLEFLIVGREGTIDLDCYGDVRVGRDDRWEHVERQTAFDPANSSDPVRLCAYADQLGDLIAAIEDDREPLVSGEDGHATIEMIEAAERSGRACTVVSIPATPTPDA